MTQNRTTKYRSKQETVMMLTKFAPESSLVVEEREARLTSNRVSSKSEI